MSIDVKVSVSINIQLGVIHIFLIDKNDTCYLGQDMGFCCAKFAFNKALDRKTGSNMNRTQYFRYACVYGMVYMHTEGTLLSTYYQRTHRKSIIMQLWEPSSSLASPFCAATSITSIIFQPIERQRLFHNRVAVAAINKDDPNDEKKYTSRGQISFVPSMAYRCDRRCVLVWPALDDVAASVIIHHKSCFMYYAYSIYKPIMVHVRCAMCMVNWWQSIGSPKKHVKPNTCGDFIPSRLRRCQDGSHFSYN